MLIVNNNKIQWMYKIGVSLRRHCPLFAQHLWQTNPANDVHNSHVNLLNVQAEMTIKLTI